MKIDKISVDGYRLLENFKLDLRDELSLIIGKNNTGKTSLLNALNVSLSGRKSYSFEDFSTAKQKALVTALLAKSTPTPPTDLSITVTIVILYDESDNLRNLSSLMVDLSPEARRVYLRFRCEITEEQFSMLHTDFSRAVKSVEEALGEKLTEADRQDEAQRFVAKNMQSYLTRRVESYDPDEEANTLDITDDPKLIRRVLNLEYVSARRSVENRDNGKGGKSSGRALSRLSSQYFDDHTGGSESTDAFLQLAAQAASADRRFSETYEKVFEDVIKKIKRFGATAGINEDIHIISNIQPSSLLNDSTSVKYGDRDSLLPEDHNGLGYLNLIAIIMEIEIRMLRMRSGTDEAPADINLMVIEEPEAHTHPQLQYIFIKQIKALLQENNESHSLQLQTLLTTHSSHITAESDFADIKYFRRIDDHVEARNMTQLEEMYDQNTNQYHFLRQYLTLTRAELFFADKAIFIEGDTERILMRAMMQKIDDIDVGVEFPLGSQNISVVEVGAHSQIFDNFIEFTGLKALIITDIDSAIVKVDADKTRRSKGVPVSEGTHTTNGALKHYFQLSKSRLSEEGDLKNLRKRSSADKLLSKQNGAWRVDSKDPSLCIAYQTAEDGYEARSYEDAFIHINRKFINNNIDSFNGLKRKKLFSDLKQDAHFLAENCVDKKTHFALDVIYASSGSGGSDWKIPSYISEGLRWLRDA